MSRMEFIQNFANLYKLDITPEESEPTWAWIAAGINDAAWNGNENADEDQYYDGGGFATTEVTGGKITISFSGHRRIGDPVQDFVVARMAKFGADRHTRFACVQPDGTELVSDATLTNIIPTGGAPNAKGTFSFDVNMNGVPEITDGTKTEFPTEITQTDTSVARGATAQLSPSVTPSSASESLVYLVEDESIALCDMNGVVTGVTAGVTYVHIRSAVRPSVTKKVKITVTSS